MSGNGGQKNLEGLKKPVHKIVTWKLAPPIPQQPCRAEKGLISTHFVQNSTLLGVKRVFFGSYTY